MRRNTGGALFAFVVAAACASQPALQPPKVERVEAPAVGEKASAAVGETMVTQYYAVGQRGFRLTAPVVGVVSPLGIKSRVRIEPQVFVFAYADAVSKTYRGQGAWCQEDLFFGCQTQSSPSITVPADPNAAPTLGMGLTSAKLDMPRPVETLVTATHGPSFKRELIFNGRSADSAKFLYREYRDDLARPAFTQELQYDLKTDKVIGFQELRVEVLGTTNVGIDYVVRKHFDWPAATN